MICEGVADRGRGVAEFVGQGRQELVLAAVGLTQRSSALTLGDLLLERLVGAAGSSVRSSTLQQFGLGPVLLEGVADRPLDSVGSSRDFSR